MRVRDRVRVLLEPDDCEICQGHRRFIVEELRLDEECWACRGKGVLSPRDRLRVWNATNPKGSFPARFACLWSGHDWEMIETLQYCTRCHALWDFEWHEIPAPGSEL